MTAKSKEFTLNTAGKTILSLHAEHERHSGSVRMETAGLLKFALHSPRPVRVWVGRHLVVDDLANRAYRRLSTG